MEILVLQHDDAVGPGLIEKIASAHSAKLRIIRLYENDAIPVSEFEAGKFAGVVALGSHSTAHLPGTNPRHDEETDFFHSLAKSGVPSFLMCYSMQLFCLVNGGEVKQNPKGKEVGFDEVFITEKGKHDCLFHGERSPFATLQSHADIVSRLPQGAVRLAYSQKTENQAAVYGGIHYLVQFDSQLAERQALGEWVAKRSKWLKAAGTDGARFLMEFEAEEKVLQMDFERIFSNFLKVCTHRTRK